MRTYTFYADPKDPESKMFAWKWEGKNEDWLFSSGSLTDKQIDHYLDYEADGSVNLGVWIQGNFVVVPRGHYVVLDYDGDLFVMSPEKFDEWFPATEYGN